MCRGRSEDYGLCPLLQSPLTQKHLPCTKASRKCLLAWCYFCGDLQKLRVDEGSPSPVPSWVQRATGRLQFRRFMAALRRHSPIFVTRRWVFLMNQSPRVRFTRHWLSRPSRSAAAPSLRGVLLFSSALLGPHRLPSSARGFVAEFTSSAP